MEEERRLLNMEKLKNDMEKTKGQTVVMSTGLKDKESGKKKIDEEEDEEEEDEEDEYEDVKLFSEDEYEEEYEEDEGEDEELAHFAF